MKASSALMALVRLGSSPTSGVYLNAAADEHAIHEMQAAAQRDLGDQIPEGYVALLRVTNGVQINGAYLKTAEHLVPENLDVLRPEVIVLGLEGNMAEFVFDRRDRQFHIINLGFPDERFASFETFDELLATVLREQQIL